MASNSLHISSRLQRSPYTQTLLPVAMAGSPDVLMDAGGCGLGTDEPPSGFMVLLLAVETDGGLIGSGVTLVLR